MIRFVGLIDMVRPGEEIPQTKEETRARWDRYARFAERTFFEFTGSGGTRIPDDLAARLDELRGLASAMPGG